MKKLTFLTLLFFVTVGMAHAQYFVGGNFSFNTSGGKVDDGTTETDKTSNMDFSFNPEAGIFLSEDLAAGAELNFFIDREKTPGDPEVIDKTTGFGISPFVRYYALQMGKFSIFGQGSLNLSTYSSKTETGGTTTDGPTYNNIGLNVYPGVAFKVSEKVELEANINAFNFGFTRSVTKQDVGGNEVKDISNDFGFGANLDGIATTGSLTIGAIIKL